MVVPSDSKNKKANSVPGKRIVVPMRWVGWALGAVLSLMLLAMLFGEHFRGVLNTLGLGWLSNEESGIYADCSKSSNRRNPYCEAKRRDDAESWRGLNEKRGGSNPFTLQ